MEADSSPGTWKGLKYGWPEPCAQQKVSAAAQNGLSWPRKAVPPCSPGWVPSHLHYHHTDKSQLSFSWFPEWESQPGAGQWVSWCTQIPGERAGRHQGALGCKEHLALHQALLSLGCQPATHGWEGSAGTSAPGLLCCHHCTIPPTAWVNAFLPYTLPKSNQKPSKPQFGRSWFVFVHLPALTWLEIMLSSHLHLPTAVFEESHHVPSHLPLAGWWRLETIWWGPYSPDAPANPAPHLRHQSFIFLNHGRQQCSRGDLTPLRWH